MKPAEARTTLAPGPSATIVRSAVMSRSPVEAASSLPLSVRSSVYTPGCSVMVSAPSPAAHSPGLDPDRESLFAARTASRSVHSPSLEMRSAPLFATIVLDARATPIMGDGNIAAKKNSITIRGMSRGSKRRFREDDFMRYLHRQPPGPADLSPTA